MTRPSPRFQQSNFQRQVAVARNYERKNRGPAKPGWLTFRSPFRSILMIIAGYGILAFIGLVLYYRPWFFIREVTVEGYSGPEAQMVRDETIAYLSASKYWPQQNTIILSSTGLKNDLLGQFNFVSDQTKVTKKFPHRLLINLVTKDPTFSLEYAGQKALLFADGTQVSNFTVDPGKALIPLIWTGNVHELNVPTIPTDQLPLLIKLSENLKNTPDLVVNNFTLSDTYIDKSTVVLGMSYKNNNFRVITNLTNPDGFITQFKQAFSALSAEQKQNINYLDLRFDNRGFICINQTPCATQPPHL